MTAYGIAVYHLFDIELRLKWTLDLALEKLRESLGLDEKVAADLEAKLDAS